MTHWGQIVGIWIKIQNLCKKIVFQWKRDWICVVIVTGKHEVIFYYTSDIYLCWSSCQSISSVASSKWYIICLPEWLCGTHYIKGTYRSSIEGVQIIHTYVVQGHLSWLVLVCLIHELHTKGHFELHLLHDRTCLLLCIYAGLTTWSTFISHMLIVWPNISLH